MASLVSVDSYLQSLGRKVCEQPRNGTPKRKAAHRDPDAPNGPKKKKKKKPRNLREPGGPAHKPGGPAHKPGGPAHKPGGPTHKPPLIITAPPSTDIALSSFSTVDLLRRRLHERIEESRGQVSNKNLSSEEIRKRREKRKQERERKKRKRKEQKMAEETPALESTAAMEKSGAEEEEPAEDTAPPPIVFNKVEVTDEPLNKVLMKKQKKQFVKGNITPMTGKNYKQLLSRLECRKSRLEELRAKDQDKAKDYERKIKWTNVLYKAEGLKIKDDEGMLRSALRRKEKRREQRKRRWDDRIQNTAEKMQRRQDKRNRNIKKKKTSKLEKKKNRARKRGRIMPEDLAKNNVK